MTCLQMPCSTPASAHNLIMSLTKSKKKKAARNKGTIVTIDGVKVLITPPRGGGTVPLSQIRQAVAKVAALR